MTNDEPTSTANGPFDVETVRQLVRLMARFDLNEIDLHDGAKRIRLRRGLPVAAAALPVPVQAAGQAPAAPAPAVGAPPAEAASGRKLLEIRSPMVGTFYAKPAPDKEDYVKVGSRVSPDTVVCQIEAMKIFNDITAKCTGTIAEVCVQNGQFVEFDQVLFRVEPS